MPYFLIYIPLSMAGFALTVVIVTVILRSRFRPNANYPRPPKVPAETPPALEIDSETGKLVLAVTSKEE
jgi:hypothetical protein